MKRHTVKEILSPDGRRRVTIFEREADCYGFREESLLHGPSGDHWAQLWQPSQRAYGSEAEAERAALGQVKWLSAGAP